jgi:hypothetical protein
LFLLLLVVVVNSDILFVHKNNKIGKDPPFLEEKERYFRFYGSFFGKNK